MKDFRTSALCVADLERHAVTSKPCGISTGIFHSISYNIAPSQEVPVIIRNDGRNEAKVMKWGLVRPRGHLIQAWASG